MFSDEDCKICFSEEEEVRVYTTEKCCSFGFSIDRIVFRNAFMRGNPEEGDRNLRRNSRVGDVNTGNDCVHRRGVSCGRESCE